MWTFVPGIELRLRSRPVCEEICPQEIHCRCDSTPPGETAPSCFRSGRRGIPGSPRGGASPRLGPRTSTATAGEVCSPIQATGCGATCGRDAEGARITARAIEKTGRQALVKQGDVGYRDQVTGFFERAVPRLVCDTGSKGGIAVFTRSAAIGLGRYDGTTARTLSVDRGSLGLFDRPCGGRI